MTAKISEDEVLAAIKCLHTGKSLGSDGITSDFYKHFDVELANILTILVYNESLELGELPFSLRLAVIVLIYKKGDVRDAGNYCPISLTNCDYKILAYILTIHLEELLPHMIHSNQTAYMKKQFIGTNICLVQDIISASATHSGIILFLDFKKAFDSINHVFMIALLLHMGLPPGYVSWVALMYQHAFSIVRHCNWLTNPFVLGWGVRQGCPLSCHLFNLVGQVLIYSL